MLLSELEFLSSLKPEDKKVQLAQLAKDFEEKQVDFNNILLSSTHLMQKSSPKVKYLSLHIKV